MATLTLRNGRGMIRFTMNGKRRTLRIGRVSQKGGDAVLSHIEELKNAASAQYPVAAATLAWTKDIDDKLHARISKLGLTHPRGKKTITVGSLVGNYIQRRSDLKPRSITNIEQARNSLIKFFGSGAHPESINAATAKDWKRHMLASLSEATVASHIKKAKQIFRDAIDRKLIDSNPLLSLKAGSQVNELRSRYVLDSEILDVIEKCPDSEWRLIFAMARFAGLRTPSEIMQLRWTDIDWGRGRFLVNSPKTEHQQKRGRRWVPIFERLAPYLAEAREAAGEGAEYVIDLHRGENIRTQAMRIIRKAGIEPWEKPFQNLRSSCETDLTARFPLHVACAWIGNTEAIAIKHYLQVTEAHFSAASGAPKGAPRSDDTTAIPDGSQTENNLQSLSQLPPRGVEHFTDIAGNLNEAHQALQNALHRSIRRIERSDVESLKTLRRSIDAAKGRK